MDIKEGLPITQVNSQFCFNLLSNLLSGNFRKVSGLQNLCKKNVLTAISPFEALYFTRWLKNANH